LPDAINHVAISVTDIKLAMQWYRDVLGMSLLREPVEISATPSRHEDEHISNIVRKVFGPKLGRFLICHMSSSNGIGIELFQFLEPKGERRLNDSNFEFWKTGFFHIAITEPNIEGLIERISSSGGVKRTEVMELVPGTGKKICFCEDPFGNVIEIYSHSYEEFWANVRA
jgi:catechol 2,3-dioxygenase-like lactoylglutathione lyase family enzyme